MTTQIVTCPRCGFEIPLPTKGRTVTAIDVGQQNDMCTYPELMTEFFCPYLQEEMARPKRASNLTRIPS